MIGRRLSHFVILEHIGSGGMGEVYLARDTRLGRSVAIKVLSPKAPDEQTRRRFLNEAKAASVLAHKNIVTIYETDSVEGVDLIAMEYVRGRPLDRVIGEGLCARDVLHYAVQIAEALDAAHEQGIVHRDLKPANVIVTPAGQVKVVDFGLARWRPPLAPDLHDRTTIESPPDTLPGAIAGTPRYMSPEQAAGEPVDARSDIFSFGVVLHEMMTGRRPFAGATTVDVLGAILRDEPPPLPGADAGMAGRIDGVVRKCLEKDRAFRYQHASDLIADLRAIERDWSGKERVGSRAAPVPAKTNRKLVLASAALLATLAAFSAIAWLTLGGQKMPNAGNFRLLSTSVSSQRAPSLSPDGSMVAYIGEDADGIPQVWVKNVVQGEPVQVTTGQPAAERPRWSPKDDQIVFGRAGAGLWSVPPLGGTPHRIVNEGRNARFSFDGDRLVFERDGGIWVANSDGSDARRIASVKASYFTGAVSRTPAFSPDGQSIVYFQPSADSPAGDLWLVPVEGGEPRQIAAGGLRGGEPVWTPDGRSIIYVSTRSGSVNLWSIPAGGGTPEPVTTGAGEDTDPEISRDGHTLIYTNTRKTYSVMRLDPETGRRTRVFERRQVVAMPSLAPSGHRLVFFSQTPSGVHLATVATDGGGQVWLTSRDGESNIAPQWSYDGQWIYFYRTRPEPSFRRIPSTGGPSEQLLPDWRWVERNGARVDRSGHLLAYSLLGPDATPARTIVRDLDTGGEHPLGAPLTALDWSNDGRFVFGTHRQGSVYKVVRCPAAGGACATLAGGVKPRVSPDGRSVYFLRSPEPVIGTTEAADTDVQLRVMSPDGANQHEVANLGPIEVLTLGYDVGPAGEIVWSSVEPGRSELWVADLR
jgi:serine/threonine protein kinase